MKTVRIKVNGRVQGVFFRANTKVMAEKLALSGFVRNMPDGSVEIEAQGEESNVNELIKWCHKGPSGSRVDEVIVEEVKNINDYKLFEIRY